MIRFILTLCMVLCLASSAFAEARSPGNYVVTALHLNVRLAANASAKLVGKLPLREQVVVLEVKDGWARISDYYDGESEGLSGNVAHWVRAAYLGSRASVDDNIKVSSAVIDAIKASEDLDEFQEIFARASQRLVNSGQCVLSDFRDIGGWWRSAAHNSGSVYYTYCGGASNNDRIYLDTNTGETFK